MAIGLRQLNKRKAVAEDMEKTGEAKQVELERKMAEGSPDIRQAAMGALSPASASSKRR